MRTEGKRNWLWAVAVIGAAAWGFAGCATSSRTTVVETETVGQLSVSDSHVYTQPVHAATDLTPSFGAIDTDEAAPVAVATVKDDLEVRPDVTTKTDGVTVGGAR